MAVNLDSPASKVTAATIAAGLLNGQSLGEIAAQLGITVSHARHYAPSVRRIIAASLARNHEKLAEAAQKALDVSVEGMDAVTAEGAPDWNARFSAVRGFTSLVQCADRGDQEPEVQIQLNQAISLTEALDVYRKARRDAGDAQLGSGSRDLGSEPVPLPDR